MKSAFGSKRKARKIQVDEDDDRVENETQHSGQTLNSSVAGPASSNSEKKAFKKSTLRQSIAFDDLLQEAHSGGENSDGPQDSSNSAIGRSNSTIKRKKTASSRLSFGLGEIISGDAAEALEDAEAFAPKKATLGRRLIESNALRKNLPHQGLPSRTDDEGRPTYSKDYLKELKSSTPSTPKDLRFINPGVEDEDGLGASELDGAMIVDTDENFGSITSASLIPSEAEIREKKERRARLAHEKDFISLNDDDGDGGRQLSLLSRKKKEETRLVREDEDLGEGFDEFVDDGRISLGKKQEREAKRRQRKEMADMINKAEGSSDEVSDDSEAERRAAYEASQTRAGMDGLVKPNDNPEVDNPQVPSKITPLPVLSECLERLQGTMSRMEKELTQRRKKMLDLEQESKDILARKSEVQELLKQAGTRYAALKADSNGAVAEPQAIVGTHNGLLDPRVVDRGLESFGNTPTTRPEHEDVG